MSSAVAKIEAIRCKMNVFVRCIDAAQRELNANVVRINAEFASTSPLNKSNRNRAATPGSSSLTGRARAASDATLRAKIDELRARVGVITGTPPDWPWADPAKLRETIWSYVLPPRGPETMHEQVERARRAVDDELTQTLSATIFVEQMQRARLATLARRTRGLRNRTYTDLPLADPLIETVAPDPESDIQAHGVQRVAAAPPSLEAIADGFRDELRVLETLMTAAGIKVPEQTLITDFFETVRHAQLRRSGAAAFFDQ